ncbi:unnamed protein product [Adineta ricciae]|uniref:LysM domain-containing protein n=1 Tax=Adineta ricciae TaxID=249248 RepID=A0A815U8N1_ADIRI|nr:unnamed protein product [Adineta ricciae]CAF1512583.1 unnamed protein product [Adineta ricciae]
MAQPIDGVHTGYNSNRNIDNAILCGRRGWSTLQVVALCSAAFAVGNLFIMYHTVSTVYPTFKGVWIYRIDNIELFLSPIPKSLDQINDRWKSKDYDSILWDESCPTHRMVPRETLYILSFKYGVSVDELIALNPVVNVTERTTGIVLRLPCYLLVPQRIYYHGMYSGSKAWFQHTIGPEDTVGKLVRYYGAELEDIVNANPGIQPDVVVNGQKVQVPISIRQAIRFLSAYQGK